MLTQKIRIFPSKEQEEVLWALSKRCRLVCNFALNERKTVWEDEEKSISYYKQQKDQGIFK